MGLRAEGHLGSLLRRPADGLVVGEQLLSRGCTQSRGVHGVRRLGRWRAADNMRRVACGRWRAA
eukprot:1419310-Prymnesium_polylepis.1